ncbi:MAG: peptidoglycan-binding protein [Rhodobacteraceae bacterium]|nr:peptidoglycan-binding protein [Paracoccaceae bacterium]
MVSRKIIAAFVGASMIVVPTTRADADTGSFVAGAIVGGLIGHAATKNNQNRKRTTTTRSRIPSTQEGRQIQASLNYFGFNAGGVDGQLGRRSREAVSRYQFYMGYPQTGYLTPFEQNILISSWNRAQAGGYAINQVLASHPDGSRGLLKTYRAELAGQTVTPQQPTTTTTIVVAPQPTAPAAPAAPAPTETANAAPALPNFLGGGAQRSLASHCNTVSLLTNSNGGFTTLASMTDPMQALNEQFCLARTYAIAQSEDLIARVQGATPDQVAAQCEQIGPLMKDHVAALSLKPMQNVVSDVAGFVLQSGMAPAQLSGTAKICMGVGYRTDNMDVAIGSGLLLFALGERVYGEAMGHHLAQGFGATQRPDLARVWYAEALTAIDAGAQPVFSPGQPERVELLRQASANLDNNAGLAAPTQVQPASALPTFGLSSN